MIRTIETDPISPFADPLIPAAEWTYRAWRDDAMAQGINFARAYLMLASQRAGRVIDTVPEFPTGQSLARQVVAFVNNGRWLWACPICNAAQVVSFADLRAFCIECFNAGDGWWPVIVPPDDDRVAGEIVLTKRPSDEERNWNPATETVRDLQNENLAHGVDPDAPGRTMIGNPVVLAQIKQRLDELGYPMIDGPEDELLELSPDELLRALQHRVEVRELEANESGDMQ